MSHLADVVLTADTRAQRLRRSLVSMGLAAVGVNDAVIVFEAGIVTPGEGTQRKGFLGKDLPHFPYLATDKRGTRLLRL